MKHDGSAGETYVGSDNSNEEKPTALIPAQSPEAFVENPTFTFCNVAVPPEMRIKGEVKVVMDEEKE
jgi:hypothetical protein